MTDIEIRDTPYVYNESLTARFRSLSDRVRRLRQEGPLSPTVLYRIRKHFKIKHIYHSNAIEGNLLEAGETRQVVELGLTITGKPLRDQAEARNLSDALDFLEDLASNTKIPITENDIRQIHSLVLKRNRSRGRYVSNSPYSFILGLMSVFSCFGTGNRRFQTVCMACRRALERVPGIDMQVS